MISVLTPIVQLMHVLERWLLNGRYALISPVLNLTELIYVPLFCFLQRKGSLPLELTNYLGEAERFLNSGQFDEAEKICQNIISQGKAST